MSTISDSEFRKAQSIALEKLRKKNLMGLLAAQRNGTLQEFVRPELEAYVKRVHPGKSLPSNFQSSETTDEISHRHSESDALPIVEAMAPVHSRKHSLPPSTKLQTPSAQNLPTVTPPIQSPSASELSPVVPQPSVTQSTPEKISSPEPLTSVSSPPLPNNFQSKKPVSSGLAARMAALNSNNSPAPPSKNSAREAPPIRSRDLPIHQPQFHSLASSAHLAKAKRLRSDAEYGEIVNVNLYRATILQNPEFHRKQTASRRHSLISGKDFSLVSVLSDEGTLPVTQLSPSPTQSRRKSLQSMDQNSIVECSGGGVTLRSPAPTVTAIETDNNSPRQSEMESSTTIPFATNLSPFHSPEDTVRDFSPPSPPLEASEVKISPSNDASHGVNDENSTESNGTSARTPNTDHVPPRPPISLWESIDDDTAEAEPVEAHETEVGRQERIEERKSLQASQLEVRSGDRNSESNAATENGERGSKEGEAGPTGEHAESPCHSPLHDPDPSTLVATPDPSPASSQESSSCCSCSIS
jgi:hypothetical protein